MPKGDKGVTCKSPGKQEMDVEARAMASLVESLEKQNMSDANGKAIDSCPTPSDGERR